MICKRFLSVIVLVSSIFVSCTAFANSFDFNPPYTGPTHLVLAGTDTTNTLRYATIYIDPSTGDGIGDAVHYYARYEYGNIFGSLTDLPAVAHDFLRYGNGSYDNYLGHGGNIDILNDPEPFRGNFYTTERFISELHVGDILTFTAGTVKTDWNTYDLTLVSAIPAGDATAPVPEPATFLLIGSGLFGLWGLRRRSA